MKQFEMARTPQLAMFVPSSHGRPIVRTLRASILKTKAERKKRAKMVQVCV